MHNHKGDEWKTATGTSGNWQRGSAEYQKGDQLKTRKGSSGKP